MRIHVGGIGLAVVTLAAIGCSESSQQLPPGPRMQATAPTSSPPVCDFKALSNLATHYFGSTEAKAVRTLISQMQGAGADSVTARNRGFDVMTHIAANVKAGNTDVADASSLTNGLLVCMFHGLADLPASYSASVPLPEDFTVATDPATFGAYDVRGATSDPAIDPVLSRSVPPLSGVAPCTTSCNTSNSWPGILSSSSNTVPHRVLMYGAPGPSPNTYEWRVVPRSMTFSPPAIVGLCLDAGGNNATSLLHEENVGLLPFNDATFLPDGCPAFGARPWSSLFASRIVRWGMDVFGPRPLSATTFFNPGGLAGSTGGIHSLFGPQEVNTVTLTLSGTMPDVVVNQPFPTLDIMVTVAGTNTPVPNVQVTVTAVNNNGAPAILGGTVIRTTDSTGLLHFDDLYETKTGGYTLVFSGTVIGRGAIAVTQATSNRFNVRPL